jgi:molecular chaperone GrpE
VNRNPDERESWVTPSAEDGVTPAHSEGAREQADALDDADAASEPGEVDEAQQYRELAQRVQADFENYRKRVLREQTAMIERANESLLEAVLPVLDSFELALPMLDDAEEKVRKGVELVYAELVGVLEKNGLERIDTDGKPFDPNVHECVLQEDGDGEPVVAETMRTGYRLKGRVLRPAMVKVTR